MNATVTELPVARIRPGQNDRTIFREPELRELADSIARDGLAQPITVRPVQPRGRYEIVAGERRYRAHVLLQLPTIACIVREYSDEEASRIMLAENLMRVDLDPIDQANAYKRRMDEFGWAASYLAIVTNVTKELVFGRLRLLQLIPDAQLLVRSGALNLAMAACMTELDVNRQNIALRELTRTPSPAPSANSAASCWPTKRRRRCST